MRYGIALGSNVGDRLAYLRAAQTALAQLHIGPDAPLVSPIYETEPVDCAPGTASYLNAVTEIEYAGEPLELFRTLQQIERDMGRPAEHGHNAPRTMDLDLLYAGNLTLESDELTLPHPRFATRRFVLQPLANIRPELVLPGNDKTIAELLNGLPAFPSVQQFAVI